MAFPLSISGHLTLSRSELTSNSGVVERLEAALSAQTVDKITVTNDTIEFTPMVRGSEGKPRPEGNGWMLNAIGNSWLRVRHESNSATISYRLECRGWFCMATALSVATGLFIHLYKGKDYEWGWLFALGIWAVMFLSGYVSKTIEFRRWLKNNLTSAELPPTKRLRVPTAPD